MSGSPDGNPYPTSPGGLPVGDELNLSIHIHVMNGEVQYFEGKPYVWAKPEVGVFKTIPNYLTGDGMLKVVAAMKEKGFACFRLYMSDGLSSDAYFYCDEETLCGCAHGEHDDAPTATGQAALKALGVIK